MGKRGAVNPIQIRNVFLIIAEEALRERLREIHHLDELKAYKKVSKEWQRFHEERELMHAYDGLKSEKDYTAFSKTLKTYVSRWGKDETAKHYSELFKERSRIYYEFQAVISEAVQTQNPSPRSMNNILPHLGGYVRNPRVNLDTKKFEADCSLRERRHKSRECVSSDLEKDCQRCPVYQMKEQRWKRSAIKVDNFRDVRTVGLR